ncbi:MAG TPA: S8 family serine peptidase, partial [Bryobacteraceae bacterium]|nr:S8 family serine peptidase [Bryobacteraceae bacterium]
MRKLILALVLCTFVCAHAGTHFHPKPNETVVPDELIIRLVPGADVRSVIASGNSSATGIGAAVSAISLFKSLRHGDIHVLKAPAGLREAIGDLLARLPGVEYVQANHVFTTTLVAPNDPGASSQWALQKVNAQQGWSLLPGQYLTASATGVNRPFVAVLDTGIDCTHPDFVNAGGTSDDSAAGGQLLFSAGQALVATSISPAACPWQDDFGHGTHVAGIVAASANNATGVVGIGWPIQVAGFKVLDGSGKGDEATISNAIMAAADEGASVISLSLGGAGYSQSMQNAVEYAWDRNVLVVAAAGNDGSSEVFFPADAVHALAVAATDSNNVTASFSNYGAAVGISAPGVNVYSTLPTYTVALNGPNYGTLSGTSMATPHVSGLAGLLALGTPAANSAAVVQRIQQSATSSIANGGWDQHYGYGVVNVFGALSATPRASTQGSVVGQVTDGTGLIQTDASQKTYVSTGLPVAGAQVVLNGQSTTTDTNGYYRFAAVAPGTWPVSVSASGFASKTLSATVAAGADTVMPVMMQAAYGEFTGTVSDHGAPVAGAIVQALSGGLIVATAVADGSGNYQLWAPAGTYNLSASALSHYSGVVPGVVVAQGAPSTVNLTITALGTITGVVSDGAGHPVSGAQVTFTGPGGFTAGAVTNSNGQYSSVGLPSGSYQVTATATGLPTTIQSATVSPDTNTSLTLSAQNTIPPAVPTFAGSVQHTSDYVTPAQHLNKILWQTSINQNNSGAMGHYGAP